MMTDLRADARRNREEILDIARQVIAAEGVDASLRDIARRAGVGIGTLYRHFPTREDLLAAIVDGGVRRLSDRAAVLAETEPPEAALRDWLRDVTSRIGPYRGLPGSMVGALIDGDSELRVTCEGMMGAGERLLASAQAAGVVRADVSFHDVFTAVAAISGIAVQSGTDTAVRVLDVYLDGLRRGVSP
jgi:AcrR family transcriptional regulator